MPKRNPLVCCIFDVGVVTVMVMHEDRAGRLRMSS